MLRRHHPRQHGVVRSLDAWHVDEAGRAADQRAAREAQLRHRLPAAFGDGARAVAEALGTREGAADRRMRLEALELLEGRQIRILVVQVHDETDRHHVVLEMIEERPAASLHVERPAERVLDQPRLVVFRLDLPQFLEADAELARLTAFGEAVSGDQYLGERAARALADQHVFAHQRHAGRIVRTVRAVLLHAHVAGDHARHRAFVVIDEVHGREARIDFDAQRLGLGRQPPADIAERDDVVAVVVHQRRHHEIGQPEGAGGTEHQEMVGGDRRLEGMIGVLAPARQQTVDADRIDDRAGKDMRADLAALLQHHDRQVRVELLQPDRSGQPRRTGADDHHVELHALPFDLAHHLLRTGLAARPSGSAVWLVAIFAGFALHSASIRDAKPAQR